MQQVSKKHYFKNYDGLHRFMHYWMQIEEVFNNDVKTILEVGCGNKTIYNYLKNYGYSITTFDFAKDLEPDIVGDIREMELDEQYDLILCCEVLEHIPLSDLPFALSSLYKNTKKYVIISVPQYYAMCDVGINFNLIKFRFFKQLRIRFPYFFTNPKFSGEHYWGLGQKGISKRRFKELIEDVGFKIVKEKYIPMNQDLYYLVLEK